MNRSSRQAFATHALVGALVAMGCSGSVGLGVVWMRHQISLVANDNKALEARLADTERRIEENTAAIAAARDPAELLRRNTEWHLGLAPPREDQVRRVTGDPELRLQAKHNRGLFGDQLEVASFRVAAQP